jgi:hypothetical protein
MKKRYRIKEGRVLSSDEIDFEVALVIGWRGERVRYITLDWRSIE